MTIELYYAAAQQPHLLFVFFDDYGWNNVGYHSNQFSNESVTPTFDGLVSSGVELDRHHVFQYCSPSRSAFHTGRNPIHVNVLNSFLDQHNPADPVSGFQGIPRNMSTLPSKLKTAGYATHLVRALHSHYPRDFVLQRLCEDPLNGQLHPLAGRKVALRYGYPRPYTPGSRV
jgi:arylsulfatase A-like enzyme